jgi:hypothetical protein
VHAISFLILIKPDGLNMESYLAWEKKRKATLRRKLHKIRPQFHRNRPKEIG